MQYSWDEDGSLILKARLPAETGALVLKALEAAVEELHGRFDPLKLMAEKAKSVSGETPVDNLTRTMQRADALGVMAEGFLKHGEDTMTGGDRCQIVVHVPAVGASVIRSRGSGGSGLSATSCRPKQPKGGLL